MKIITTLAALLALAGCSTVNDPVYQLDRQVRDAARVMKRIYPETGNVPIEQQEQRVYGCLAETMDRPDGETMSNLQRYRLVVDCYRENGWIS